MSIRPAASNHGEAPVEQLCIYMLGPPHVTWEGHPLPIPRRQARALLYRLATHLDPLSREQLGLLLWPNVPEITTRTNLSRLLNHLRRALPDPGLLLTQEGQIGLDPTRVWSDTRAWTEALRAPPSSIPADTLQRIVALYRGSFLEGFSLPHCPEFDQWLIYERGRWERQYLEALAALVEMEIHQGAYEAAIAHALRYLEIDELAEDVHRQLIELYNIVGNRSAALRQFERCVAVLERELGVSPLPETRAAYQAALEGRLSEQQPVQPAWTTLPSLEAPFVGRGEAMYRLRQAYAHVQAGRGEAVLISGEPGIGKSRLLQEFVDTVRHEATTVVGGGHGAERGLPYWPLMEALRPHLTAVDWTTLPIARSSLAEITQLLPELRASLPELSSPAPAEPGQERARLFRALADLLLALAARRPPLILCLDDLHWADEATRSWLGYLGRRIRHVPVLILGAYRTGEAAAVAALRTELARLGLLQEVRLDGLTEEDVLYLVRYLSGQASGAEQFSQRMHRETGGNPFFLLEILRAMFEAGILWEDDTGWSTPVDEATEDYRELPLPDTVIQAIRTRLARLSPQARQVAEAGAVIGRRFDMDLVQATSGRREDEVVDALDMLVARQLISEHEGVYRFDHDLVQTVVYRDLSHGRRRLLHRRAGEALERRQIDDTATLAWHYERAEQADKAVTYLLQAGDRARGLYAYPEAIRHYQRALALLKEQGDHERAARTLMRLGLTYHIAFDFQKAREAYDQGFALWQRAGTVQPITLSPTAPHAFRVDWPHLLTVDPALAGDANSGGVIEQLFSGLVESSPNMNIIPDVAYSWDVLEGGRTYIFHLRDDIRWSDGVPVTAWDFEYAWKRVLDPDTQSPCASLLYDVKGARAFHQGNLRDPDSVGVRALDETTLLVELEGPISYFLHILAHSVTRPVPRHAIEAHGEAWTQTEHLVTNGPFRLHVWEWGRRVVLTRNPGYHGRFTGNVEQVELYLLVDPEAKVAKLEMYEGDTLDVLSLWWGLPPAEMERVRQKHAGEHISAPQFFIRCVCFNVSYPPFDDRQVRQAFAHAIDRGTLAHVVMRGLASPATGGFVPPGMPGHSPDIGLRYDPDRARELLAQAGYARGQGFPVIEWATFSGSEIVAEQLQKGWRRILGVEIRQETLEWGPYEERVFSGRSPVFLRAWMADYPDPDNFLRQSDHRHPTRWEHATYDALIEQAKHVVDQQERMSMYRRADEILIKEASIIPLVYSRQNMLVKPWVRRYPASPYKWWFWKDIIIEPH
ncbi:MAG TPA: AAA family ATPase [Caldilineae bacterium]|nr:AAA family ATPase [Caldilineae bacterium]